MDNRKGKGSRQVIPSISSKKTTVVVAASQDLKIGTKRPAERSLDYEWTSRIKREDKQSGNYQRYTTKEKVSSGEPHVERGTGKVGTKNEFKTSSTVKIGNKNTGYTEHTIEERFRDVEFGKTSKQDPPIKCLTGGSSYNNDYCSGYDCGYSWGNGYDDCY